MDKKTKPTAELYGLLQSVYDKFNEELFASKLPEIVITLQREKNTMGYFSRDRWLRNDSNKKVHEIAVNPAYFACYPLIEVLQTMAHEMCHLYQYEYGKPGRGRYHNVEFAQTMENIGLMASSTGRPGGKRTGQKMNDYPINEGRFAKVCLALHREGFFLPWVDRFPVAKQTIAQKLESIPQPGELSLAEQSYQQYEAANLEVLYVDLIPQSMQAAIVSPTDRESLKRHSKTKYTCQCGINIWGKPKLSVQCNECGSTFSAA